MRYRESIKLLPKEMDCIRKVAMWNKIGFPYPYTVEVKKCIKIVNKKVYQEQNPEAVKLYWKIRGH